MSHSAPDRIDGDGLRGSNHRPLWRLYGPTRVVVAAIRPRGRDAELYLFYEPESSTHLLARERGDLAQLLRQAAFIREQLLNHGWVELGSSAPSPPLTRRPGRRTVAGFSVVTAGVAALSWWRRTRRARARATSAIAVAAEREDSL